jgi:hypothetical protein
MADSQNDMLMWLMSEAKGVERSPEGLARRLLAINLAAIHSSSLASDDITDILSPLSCSPNYFISIDGHASTVPSSCES